MQLVKYEGKFFRKIAGRCYRSFWKCIQDSCEGQIMFNDLKGGCVKVVADHIRYCNNKGSKQYYITNTKFN